VPDRCDQVVPADDTVSISDEVGQKVENLRLEWNQCLSAPQLASFQIESVILEQIEHLALRTPDPAQVLRQQGVEEMSRQS
jgi:hypothetical protein